MVPAEEKEFDGRCCFAPQSIPLTCKGASTCCYSIESEEEYKYGRQKKSYLYSIWYQPKGVVKSRRAKSMNHSGLCMAMACPPSQSLHPCQQCTDRCLQHSICSFQHSICSFPLVPDCLPNTILNSLRQRKNSIANITHWLPCFLLKLHLVNTNASFCSAPPATDSSRREKYLRRIQPWNAHTHVFQAKIRASLLRRKRF
ncbi:uncharacterized protein LOC109835745 [Asparagus officinalis]|uniref:uncharacterized protein LOC109835745 n=1 Tax=Asparagus officinalis TaxID=4686 RepID=UPI00098E7486|nr:uncharacterized protein LOC109835745 [Asparagus officinalis]